MQFQGSRDLCAKVQELDIAPLPPLGAEIEAARRDLLIAARHGPPAAALPRELPRSSDHYGDVNPDDDPRSQYGWLHPRDGPPAVARHRSAELPQSPEAEGLMRASLGRLDARVRGLESQGVRVDRRAAEFAGLAQALTEEQRALLIRLDRLEEQLRAGGLCRARDPRSEARSDPRDSSVEQEQRLSSANFRQVMSMFDELDQRQQQRMRRMEELVQGQLGQIEGRLKALPLSAHGAQRSERPAVEESASLASMYCADSLRQELAVAETKTARTLKSAQDLLSRCEGVATTCQENVDPRLGVQTLAAHDGAIRELTAHFADVDRKLAPRVEVAEAKVQGLADAMQHMRSQVLEAVDARIQGLTRALEGLRDNMQELPKQLAARASRRDEQIQNLEAHARAAESQGIALEEMRRRVEALPTREQVMELGRAKEVTMTSRRVEAHDSQIADILTKLDLLPMHEQVSASRRDSESLHIGTIKSLQKRVDQLEIFKETQHLPPCHRPENQEMEIKRRQETPAKLEQSLEDHGSAISDLRLQLKAVPTSHQMRAIQELIDSQRAKLEVLASEVRTVGAAGADAVAAVRCQLQDVSSQRTSEMHHSTPKSEEVDERVLTSVAQMELQFPEISRQLERLAATQTEQAGKLEEHEVRLASVLNRQASREQKFQDCMDRVEQLPGPSSIRALCCEELTARLSDVNLADLAHRVELTMEAVAELGERLPLSHAVQAVPVAPATLEAVRSATLVAGPAVPSAEGSLPGGAALLTPAVPAAEVLPNSSSWGGWRDG